MLALLLGVSLNSLHQILGRTGTTDIRTLRTVALQKGVLGAKSKTAISTGVQGRGRTTGALFGQIYLTDRQRPWSLGQLFKNVG